MSEISETQATDAQPQGPKPTRTVREFVYDGRVHPDPDPTMTPDGVRKLLAEYYQELSNAETREERKVETREGETVEVRRFTFTKRVGTKGATTEQLIETLAALPEQRLRVFELARGLMDERGELRLAAAAIGEPETNLALAEAEANARATKAAREALVALPAR
jgi:PRTRC genetic system protein C